MLPKLNSVFDEMRKYIFKESWEPPLYDFTKSNWNYAISLSFSINEKYDKN